MLDMYNINAKTKSKIGRNKNYLNSMNESNQQNIKKLETELKDANDKVKCLENGYTKLREDYNHLKESDEYQHKELSNKFNKIKDEFKDYKTDNSKSYKTLNNKISKGINNLYSKIKNQERMINIDISSIEDKITQSNNKILSLEKGVEKQIDSVSTKQQNDSVEILEILKTSLATFPDRIKKKPQKSKERKSSSDRSSDDGSDDDIKSSSNKNGQDYLNNSIIKFKMRNIVFNKKFEVSETLLAD